MGLYLSRVIPRLGSLSPNERVLVSSAARVFWDCLELVTQPNFVFQVDDASGQLMLRPDGSSGFFTFIGDKFSHEKKRPLDSFRSDQLLFRQGSLGEASLDTLRQVGDRSSSLFINSKGNLRPLGTLAISRTGTKSFRISCNDRHYNLAEAHKSLSGDLLETIEVQETSEKQGLTRLSFAINKPTVLWDSFLALGINVPLLLCYESIGLEYQVRQTVPLDFIESNSLIASPFYKLAESKSKTVAIDLDGTLHVSGFPIASSVGWVKKLVSQGYKINVLTRNLENPLEIIENLGIMKSINRLEQVRENQKKSELIEEAGLFIDDEFNQRVDVFESKRIPSISIEQLRFLEKQ